MELSYSQGFNPRPRLSLPLPRSVGVETEDDLLCLRLAACRAVDGRSESPTASFDAEQFKARLSAQLPDGCDLLTVTVAEAKASFQPRLATYVLTVRPQYLGPRLEAAIKRLLASESLNLQRRLNAQGSVRSVDVRPFLKSIDLHDGVVVVECKVSSAGSIRVEEILKLLQLDTEMLAAPIRRTSIQWQTN